MSSAALLSLRAVLLGACARVRLGVLGALFFFFFLRQRQAFGLYDHHFIYLHPQLPRLDIQLDYA